RYSTKRPTGLFRWTNQATALPSAVARNAAASHSRQPCRWQDDALRTSVASARQRRQGSISREAENRRRVEILPRLQRRGREVWFVGAGGKMLRLERKRLGLAIRRA